MYTVIPDWNNVKPLGRTHQLPDCLWLCFSGAGAEFTFHGSRCEITIAGDVNAYPSRRDDLVRIAIYVDGVRVVDDMVDGKEKTYTVLDADAPRDVVVRIVKLSETAMSTCVMPGWPVVWQAMAWRIPGSCTPYSAAAR